MKVTRSFGTFPARALVASLLSAGMAISSAWAQSTAKPLNLKLPPQDLLPPSASTAPMQPSATTAKPAASPSDRSRTSAPNQTAYAKDPPGTFYGDTSAHVGEAEADQRPDCDDATYNKPQVHGSVGMGVVSGSHIGTGTYQGGTVNLSQAFGSCDHPTGGMSISVGGTTGNFHGR